jgi:hypothetical protein
MTSSLDGGRAALPRSPECPFAPVSTIFEATAAQQRRPTNAHPPPVLPILDENQLNQPKCLSMNYLRAKRCFPNQAQSRLIKANQVIFRVVISNSCS